MRRRTAEGLYTGQGSRSGRNARKSAGKENNTEEGDKMIRTLVSRLIADGKNYVELACLSTDTKPTADVCTGSLALEVDTGDVYAYDEHGAEWDKVAALGGGS